MRGCAAGIGARARIAALSLEDGAALLALEAPANAHPHFAELSLVDRLRFSHERELITLAGNITVDYL